MKSGTPITGQMNYGLMTVVFCILLLINNGFSRNCKKKLCDLQRHSFHFEQTSLISINVDTAELSVYQKVHTDGQITFQL